MYASVRDKHSKSECENPLGASLQTLRRMDLAWLSSSGSHEKNWLQHSAVVMVIGDVMERECVCVEKDAARMVVVVNIRRARMGVYIGLGVLRVALASLRWVASRAVGGRDMGHGVMKSGQDEGIRTANNEPTVPRDVLSVCTEIRTRRLHRVTRL